MFSDNTLTPREAIRLCALGTLALATMRYSELAIAVRHFVSRVLGPSLDAMGPSLELLRYEGLIEAVDGMGMEDDARMVISEAGRKELVTLLTANLRAAATDLNKLIVALKFRFLHLLDTEDRLIQADLLLEVSENELARLEDLREHHRDDEGFLVQWLDHDIDSLEARLSWLNDFRDRMIVPD
jgi:DNA-binding PadR family transcriptional regulator